MRLAIVSDIHGNLTALEAVIADIERRGVDVVVHGGDLALGGCQPAEVVDRIRELGWPGIVGNTDQLLWTPDSYEIQLGRAPKLQPLLDQLFHVYAPVTRELLGAERIGWLRGLPDQYAAAGAHLVHASPGDLWKAPRPDADDRELAETYEPCNAKTVVYGHIHRPYVRTLDRFVVVNSGSVGSPFDGDPRASYALVEPGGPQIIRVEYDIEREVQLLSRSRHPDASRIARTRHEGRFVPVRD
jgi:predicted phosphodiesterase